MNYKLDTSPEEAKFKISAEQLALLKQFRPAQMPEENWEHRMTTLPGLLDSRYHDHDTKALWLWWAHFHRRATGGSDEGENIREILNLIKDNVFYIEDPHAGLHAELVDPLTSLLSITNNVRDKTVLVLGIRILQNIPLR